MHQLETHHVSIALDHEKIIEDISLYANKGELVSLLGLSGSGKSTLFNCIAGIYTPDEGNIYLDGKDITGTTGNVSYMLQKDLLLPYRTIEDNVILPLLLKGMNKNEARRIAEPSFSSFGLEGTQKKYPKQLSGGMRQRAALLRTYLFSGSVALLDEPFSALDTITRSAIHNWYLNVMEEIQLTTLFITHDINEALILSDRIYIMTGTPGTIKNQLIINVPRKEREGFDLTEEFLRYKKQIIQMLHSSSLIQ